MNRTAQTLIVLASLLALPGPVHAAGPMKVWVAGTGSDANPCTLAQPCATFQHAINTVAPGGEIGVRAPGDYGPLTISNSLSITNDGVGEADVSVGSGGVGVTVGAGVGDVVGLRGLVIDGQGGGAIGIQIDRASAVHIQNCVIRNFQSAGTPFGIRLQPNFNSNQLFVSDTIIFNNGSGATSGGILVQPLGTGKANVVLHRVHLENNVRGIQVDGALGTGEGAHVVIRNSVASGNAAEGILAFSLPGQAPAFVVVEKSSSVNNAGTGILANGPRATILLNDNSIKRNGTGISAVNSGQIISYGNNSNNNNLGAEGAPTGFFNPM